MTFNTGFSLVAGFAMLFIGGELLIRGASRVATALGLSPLVVGLTVVAFSTSAPELAVTLQSANAGQAEIALGNIIGSNIGNVLLILGVSALVAPLVVQQKLIQIDVPLMIAVSVGVWALAADGQVAAWEGAVLVAGIVAYTTFAIWHSRRTTPAIQAEYQAAYGANPRAAQRQLALILASVVGGIGLLIWGASWLVDGAVRIARWLGLSELIIGLTIIAVGTSLPELVTSIIAALRNERDIAVGNVVGSNIFNLLSVLGLTALFAPSGVPVPTAALYFDFPVMVTVAAACLPVFFSGNAIARWEGVLFLGYYGAYLLYLVLAATHHAALPMVSATLLGFILPLTFITLAVITVNEWRARRVGKIAP